MRVLMQSGLRPMVLRLYDPFDTLMALGKQDDEDASESFLDGLSNGLQLLGNFKMAQSTTRAVQGLLGRVKNGAIAGALSVPGVLNRVVHALPSACLLIVGFEGPESRVNDDLWRAGQLLTEAGGTDAGPKPGEHWLRRRYDVSFKQSKVYGAGAFVDTMEVATTWDRLFPLFVAVREAVTPYALVMAHFSHAYTDGCSIYFTFAATRRDPKKALELYERLWTAALDAAASVGATASHHHGVGLAKKRAMVAEHGEMLRVWRSVKDTLDPKGIMNPGKLFPDGAGSV